MNSRDRARLLTQWGFTFSLPANKKNWKHQRQHLLCNGLPMSAMRATIKDKIIEETDSNPHSLAEWGYWLDVALLLACGKL